MYPFNEQEALERVMDGSSWSDFCDLLKAAGEVLTREGSPADPLTRAEGLRYLSRLTRAGLEAFVEHNDPLHPVLRRVVPLCCSAPPRSFPKPQELGPRSLEKRFALRGRASRGLRRKRFRPRAVRRSKSASRAPHRMRFATNPACSCSRPHTGKEPLSSGASTALGL